MDRNFILIFILLVTLSMVNAAPYQLHKRTTEFDSCPTDPPVPQLTVTISPDPIVKGKSVDITFSGSLDVDVPAAPNSFVGEVAFLDAEGVPVVDPIDNEFCSLEGIKCPLKAKTSFSTVLKGIPVPDSSDLVSMAVSVVENKTEFVACAWANPVLVNSS